MARGTNKIVKKHSDVKSRKPTPHPRNKISTLKQLKQTQQVLGKRKRASPTHQRRPQISLLQRTKKREEEEHERDSFSSDSSMADYEYSDESSSGSQRLQFNKDLQEIKEPQRNGFHHNHAPTQQQLPKKNPISVPVQRPGVPDGTDPNNPVRVYADGVFDMYHIGHARVLEQAKKLFPHTYLIVGVSGDQETIEKKGKIVNNEWERSEILKHCKWVDEVILPCPWIVTVDFLRKHNIHYVAHDEAPYGGEGQEDIYADVKKLGMFKATQRTDGISTSDIILRIIKDYDMYVWRSLKRGYSRKDLGISAFKEQRIKFKEQYKEFRESLDKEHFGKSFDNSYDKMRSRVSKMVSVMENNTSEMMFNFLKQFGVKDQKSVLGGVFGIKKRDEKAQAKAAIQMMEEPLSDFDY